MIIGSGWRDACWALGLLLLIVRGANQPFVAQAARGHRPAAGWRRRRRWRPRRCSHPTSSIRSGPSVDWTVRRAVRTARFWWLALGYFCALYAWYAVQVHQTKYLQEIGFSANRSAWALGLVSLIGVVGKISLGHVSDRIGREWIWGVSMLGFVICFLALIVLQHDPSMLWLYLMVAAQGGLGYGLTSVMGAMVAEIFQGRHFGGIFGSVMLSAMAGGAAGPWVTGVLHDAFGDYVLAFWLGAGISVVSALAIWQASPRKVRAVAGRVRSEPARQSQEGKQVDRPVERHKENAAIPPEYPCLLHPN